MNNQKRPNVMIIEVICWRTHSFIFNNNVNMYTRQILHIFMSYFQPINEGTSITLCPRKSTPDWFVNTLIMIVYIMLVYEKGQL